MSEAKASTAAAADLMEELVSYTAPYSAREEDRDIFVAVNGETIRIQRGSTVQIKRKFLEVLEAAARQENAARRARLLAQARAKTPYAQM